MSFSIFPRTVFKTKTKINGEIVVKEQLGQYTLHVQGMIQSGGIVKEIWKKSLNKIGNWKLEIGNCLILGLGGGTVVQLIKKRWPEAKVIGIEIDPEIIKIGRKFFGLGKTSNLKIVEDDAFNFVAKTTQKFDLIIIDMYLGNKFPQGAGEENFFKEIKNILSPKGIVIFNRLRIKVEELDFFEKSLKKYFVDVYKVRTSTNLFFLVFSVPRLSRFSR